MRCSVFHQEADENNGQYYDTTSVRWTRSSWDKHSLLQFSKTKWRCNAPYTTCHVLFRDNNELMMKH